MTVRHHPITGDPILYAPERATRPRAFTQEELARCPFCPGHESDTPPAISTIGNPWRVRIFPNKYPSVAGAEVIVESERHELRFDTIAHPEEVVQTYVDRYRANAHAGYTAIFKNEGPRGGASIPHVHSQVMPLPFVPPRVARETAGFARAPHCPLCRLDGAIIAETLNLRWIAPSASSMPYQQWIVPKRHLSEMSQMTDDEVLELSQLLQMAAGAMIRLGDSYNWSFLNFPRERAAHAYVELFPRLSAIAGFELGTGTFVEIIDPAGAARRLKELLASPPR